MTFAAQRKTGLASVALVLLLTFVFIGLFDADTLTGWVSYLAMSCTPIQVVLAVHWAHDLPPGLARRPRPVRGGILVAITLALGSAVALLFEATVGGGNGPHFPPLVMFSIVAVVVSFWLAIVLAGWPFVLLGNKAITVAAMLLTCYVVALLAYRGLFDFSFLRGTPVYIEGLDPGGAFNAWYALTFLVTSITGMFLVRSFEFWPFAHINGAAARGAIWTGVCLLWGTLMFGIGVGLFGVDVVAFLVRVAIPLLFGGLTVLNVLRGPLYIRPEQPLRGVLNVITVATIGSGLVLLFQVLSLLVAGLLSFGPPTYDLEIWLASATLGVAFPLLVLHAEFLDFWPFGTNDRPTDQPQTTISIPRPPV